MLIKLTDRKIKDKDGKEVIRKAPNTLSGYGVKRVVVDEDKKSRNVLGTVKITSEGLDITEYLATQEPYSRWLQSGVCEIVKPSKGK